ncbi:hypothetical protein [Symbiobacterium thermophilum]|uniref:Uncharacterized protein n=1 Tax=Symbiobacterium thermophilum (strain DSM 24528 / JCM 14929 / IAM 14863 / T) TaxID=292459 RepID=Q67RA2_SYMTH|nr:hypothetical protein [Symbiobacterium thermophilum]BAD39791.1 hypothetical protein STH806 [Symbiobacterium thermophilum IAM 14863]
MTEQPWIASFVVRLTGPPLRVLVRHVQSGQEMRCLRLEEALAFMEHCLQLSGKTEGE